MNADIEKGGILAGSKVRKAVIPAAGFMGLMMDGKRFDIGLPPL